LGSVRLPKSFYTHLFAALLAGLALRLFFIWHFPSATGDTPYYEELARNWLYHGVYGFYFDGRLDPSDIRVPGYPTFLAAVYSVAGPSRSAVLIAQAFLDLITCLLTALLAARLAEGLPETARNRVMIAALWLSVSCPFTANFTAVPLTEVLATLLTTIALLIFLLPSAYRFDLIRDTSGLARSVRTWLLGGIIVALGTLVRPETPLLLVAVVGVYWIRWWRPVYLKTLTLATLCIAAGLLLPLAPWAARNAHTLGRVQFLAPRYAERFGVRMPTGFYAWTKTWMFRSRDAYLFTWKLPRAPIALSDVPPYAYDSADEYRRVAALLERYNHEHGMSALTDQEFANLARERASRHPFRTYLWIPIERTAAMWLTPRITLLPYSGKIWPPGDAWHNNYADFTVTVGFTLLNFIYAGMALLGVKRWRTCPGIAVVVAFILIRTAFLTQLQTCEPRYVLECFPALLALGALAWSGGNKASNTSLASFQLESERVDSRV